MLICKDVEYHIDQARKDQHKGNMKGCNQFYNNTLKMIDEKLKLNHSNHDEKVINH